MFTITQYIKPETLAEAYELNQKKSGVVLGGMTWLKMRKKSVGVAIDLSGLGLDTIEEDETSFRLGAMVTLRQAETHAGLNAYTGGTVAESLKSIVGVQFRNCATIGGSIFGRFGFSDVLTMFLALDADVELYKAGIIPLRTFAAMKKDNDILVRVIVKKQPLRTAYLSQRNTKTDFPVLTCAITQFADTGSTLCVIGARPGKAVCFTDERQLLSGGITEETACQFAQYIQEQVKTGTNMRASAEYRKIIAGVLVKRALLSLSEQ